MNKIKNSDKKNSRPVCKKCSSGYIYITKKKIVCRRCGHIEHRKKKQGN